MSKRFRSTNPSLHKAVIRSGSFLIYVHTCTPIGTAKQLGFLCGERELSAVQTSKVFHTIVIKKGFNSQVFSGKKLSNTNSPAFIRSALSLLKWNSTAVRNRLSSGIKTEGVFCFCFSSLWSGTQPSQTKTNKTSRTSQRLPVQKIC